MRLQTVLNELIHNVAHDADFLRETLASTIAVDDFTGKLFKIFETVLAEGISQVSYTLKVRFKIAAIILKHLSLSMILCL